jgi:hypothetical protein
VKSAIFVIVIARLVLTGVIEIRLKYKLNPLTTVAGY